MLGNVRVNLLINRSENEFLTPGDVIVGRVSAGAIGKVADMIPAIEKCFPSWIQSWQVWTRCLPTRLSPNRFITSRTSPQSYHYVTTTVVFNGGTQPKVCPPWCTKPMACLTIQTGWQQIWQMLTLLVPWQKWTRLWLAGFTDRLNNKTVHSDCWWTMPVCITIWIPPCGMQIRWWSISVNIQRDTFIFRCLAKR